MNSKEEDEHNVLPSELNFDLPNVIHVARTWLGMFYAGLNDPHGDADHHNHAEDWKPGMQSTVKVRRDESST
jgi:hypothetical protein